MHVWFVSDGRFETGSRFEIILLIETLKEKVEEEEQKLMNLEESRMRPLVIFFRKKKVESPSPIPMWPVSLYSS